MNSFIYQRMKTYFQLSRSVSFDKYILQAATKMRKLLFLGLIGAVCCKDSILRAVPQNPDQLRWLDNAQLQWSFSKPPTTIGRYADILAYGYNQDSIRASLDKKGIPYSVFIDDVGQEAAKEAVGMGSHPETFGFDIYHTDSEIDAWVRGLDGSVPGVTVSKVSRGSEGRDILAVSIPSSSGQTNETIIIEANIQALDWIATSSATYIINEILNGTNKDAKWLSENYNLIIIPVANPDGFHRTVASSRSWRKTYECEEVFLCGTDANRNWGYHWGEVGGGYNRGGNFYIGSQAFSTVETRLLSQFITSQKDNLVGYFALHSYGQQILFPYGYTGDHLDDYANEAKIAATVSLVLRSRRGVQYTYGSIYEESGPQSGTSADWVKGTLGTPIVYQINLGGKDDHAYMIPPDQIVPTGELVIDAVATTMKLYKKGN